MTAACSSERAASEGVVAAGGVPEAALEGVASGVAISSTDRGIVVRFTLGTADGVGAPFESDRDEHATTIANRTTEDLTMVT